MILIKDLLELEILTHIWFGNKRISDWHQVINILIDYLLVVIGHCFE